MAKRHSSRRPAAQSCSDSRPPKARRKVGGPHDIHDLLCVQLGTLAILHCAIVTLDRADDWNDPTDRARALSALFQVHENLLDNHNALDECAVSHEHLPKEAHS